ncbi:MAG TPA: hypothetical protein VED84_04440 [Acidimicrobiales bacterium]|nr:hypothetical protein [Acidimicrobiales bacterium]
MTAIGEADPRAEDPASLEHGVDDLGREPRARVLQVDPEIAPGTLPAFLMTEIAEATSYDGLGVSPG